ncbi:MAG: 3-oxoacyl-ACP reductase FabG [Ruminococcus sp.]|nr:3-oxoacyl-ACP reductase FabG [Ruminococcus sp.]MCM1479415.1 3-oxoacyl-ACP reductase FabG [Muribaculaceae bacterium]
MKTVLITGASRGIGRAAAYAFARAGYSVAVNYRSSAEKAAELCRELEKFSVKALPFKADVSHKGAVEKMCAEIEKSMGGIDVLINNAGIAEQALFTDITEEMWDRMFAVNVKGAYNCTQAVLPRMIHEKSGRIVNISSMWGIAGASCEVHYSASKAALIGFTKALAKEVGLSGITVNCVAPGVISTDMNGALPPEVLADLKAETPLNRLGTPEDVANAILFLASEKAAFITGQILSVDGGFIL